jgi:olefin beta-lactone synthetase
VETAARGVRGVRNAALLNVGATPVLAVERADSSAPEFPPPEWTQRGAENLRVVIVPRIPMDRRHNSKVDYGRLREMLRCAP